MDATAYPSALKIRLVTPTNFRASLHRRHPGAVGSTKYHKKVYNPPSSHEDEKRPLCAAVGACYRCPDESRRDETAKILDFPT